MAGRILTIIGAAALNSLALPAAADEASNPRARNSFTLAGEDLTFWPLTIAERYYIWRGNETLAGRGIISVSARCRLWSTDGLAFEVPGLLPVACAIFDANGTELAEDNPLRRLATRYIQRSLPYLPNDLFEGVDWADYSSVQFGMNLSTGELEPWSISRAGRWSRRTTSRSTPDRCSSTIRRERYAGARGGARDRVPSPTGPVTDLRRGDFRPTQVVGGVRRGDPARSAGGEDGVPTMRRVARRRGAFQVDDRVPTQPRLSGCQKYREASPRCTAKQASGGCGAADKIVERLRQVGRRHRMGIAIGLQFRTAGATPDRIVTGMLRNAGHASNG